MAQSAYIKLVQGSTLSTITLDDVKRLLNRYIELTSKTGQQLDWSYEDAAFPYTIESKPEAEGQWFYLKGKEKSYRYILFGISEKDGSPCIQVTLPDDSTFADKSKGNELCKFLGKDLKAELHLFNGRIMYFNPRK